MARIKRKPKTPEQIQLEKLRARERDLAAVNLPESIATLETGSNVEIVRAGDQRDTSQRAKRDAARRLDVFDRINLPTAHFLAVRQLEHDMIIRRGEGDRGRSLGRVDCETKTDHTDAQIKAAQSVEAALKTVGERDGWLLSELIYPTRPYNGWRDIVFYITGEANEHAQASAVRSACANLAPHYSGRKAA